MKLSVEGKRALVTGSSGGIGRGVARALAAEGVRLVVHGCHKREVDRTVATIIGDGGCAESVVGDLSTAEGVVGVLGAVFARGSIDILVHNACEPDPSSIDWLSIPDENWEKQFSNNVMSAVRTIRAVVPAMRRRGWGRIITISSASTVAPAAAIADYQASAAALTSLTVSLARSLAGTGVTANMISAGGGLAGQEGGRRPSSAVDADASGVGQTATSCHCDRHHRSDSRSVDAGEIGAAAALLVSKSADFTTGTNLYIGGA